MTALRAVILRERSEPNGSHAELQGKTHGTVHQGDPSTALGMTNKVLGMTSMVLRMALNPVILRERSEPNGSHAELQRQKYEAVHQGDPSTALGMTNKVLGMTSMVLRMALNPVIPTERNDEGSQTTNTAQLTPM